MGFSRRRFARVGQFGLKASHAVFFLLEANGFRADRGTSFVPLRDPVVAYFENHPAVVDGTAWENGSDPVAELADQLVYGPLDRARPVL